MSEKKLTSTNQNSMVTTKGIKKIYIYLLDIIIQFKIYFKNQIRLLSLKSISNTILIFESNQRNMKPQTKIPLKFGINSLLDMNQRY